MFRISVRQMLVLVAMVALAIASLKFADVFWVWIVVTVAMISFSAGMIVAFVDRGVRQAFAIGFVLLAAGYGYLVNNDTLLLPTARLSELLYRTVESGRWIDSETGKELPGFDPQKTPQRVKSVGGQLVPIDAWEDRPERRYFDRVAHVWWALLLGYAGGVFAMFVYRRRLRDEEKLPAEGR